MAPSALSTSTLIGDPVRNPAGEQLGKLEEIVIFLDSGQVAYAVLSAGGVLGVGDRFFAVPWSMISVDTDSHELVVDVEKDLIEDSPGFDKDNWPDGDDSEWLTQVYSHYGQEPFWHASS